MRDFQRERRLIWYLLLLECIAVLYVISVNGTAAGDRVLMETAAGVLLLLVSRYLTVQTAKVCPDFVQGAVTIGGALAVFGVYVVENGSDRLLAVCVFLSVVAGAVYKNRQLMIFVAAANLFLIMLALSFGSLGLFAPAYRQGEYVLMVLVLLTACGMLLFMQMKDRFLERVAKEDEKSLDDLLTLVEMKCEEATAAAAAKSSFLANMSHEIRTPINAVLGMNEMILREEQDEELRGYARNIQSAVTTLLSLINDILDISKIESGKMEVVPERYELNSLLYDVLIVIRPRAEQKNLQLILDIDENIPNVLYGDEVRIRQIITNILTNAVKYTEKGSVTLRLRAETKDERHVVLKVAVRDTGIGIRDSKEQLYASFQRGDDLRAHHIEGTGLGLAITQQLLEMMDSTLEMESVYGKGSLFYFDLVQRVIDREPLGNLNDLYQQRMTKEAVYKESFTAPEAHILVVDDNAMNRTVIQALLKQTLVQIDTAQDGTVCLEKCAAQRYDLILMDHLMPHMDGIEAFHALRADEKGLNYRTPVIVLTANAVVGMRQKYLDEGFNGFLSKPVQAQLLEETLRQYLPRQLMQLTEQTPSQDDDANRQLMEQAMEQLGLNDISFEDALQYSSGTTADVLANIRSYLREAPENAQHMRTFYQEQNWKDLKIYVHALKGTSRVIGAVYLAYLAERMEQAVGAEDVVYIRDHFETLLTEHRLLCEQLEQLLAVSELAALLPAAAEVEEDLDAYRSQLEIFLEGVRQFEIDFEQLRAFCSCYPKGLQLAKEREQLAQAVEDFDYEQIEQLLEQLTELLDAENR